MLAAGILVVLFVDLVMKRACRRTSAAIAIVTLSSSLGVLLGVMAVPIVVIGLFWGPLQHWTQVAFRMWG